MNTNVKSCWKCLITLLIAVLLVACGASDAPQDQKGAPAAEEAVPQAEPNPLPTLSATTERNLVHLAHWREDKLDEKAAAFASDTASGPLVEHLRAHPEYGQAFEMLSEILDSAAMRRHQRVFSDLTADQIEDVVGWCKGDLYPDTPGVFNQKRFSGLYGFHILKPLRHAQSTASSGGN